MWGKDVFILCLGGRGKLGTEVAATTLSEEKRQGEGKDNDQGKGAGRMGNVPPQSVIVFSYLVLKPHSHDFGYLRSIKAGISVH